MSQPGDPAGLAAGVVDTHQHVWDLAAHAQPWLELPGHEPLLRNFSEADLRPQAAAAGVTSTVVVQTATEASETPELLAIAAASDLITGVVGWTDLQSPAVADELAAVCDQPGGRALVSIRHPVLIETDPRWLARPSVLAGLAAVGRAGLCYDIVVPAALLPVAAEAVAACPDVTFVLDHLGNPEVSERADGQPDPAWMHDIRRLAALPNTVCKLSGILGEPPPSERTAGSDPVAHLVPYYEAALSCFGPDRLMFGSDWPVCTLSATYAEIMAAAKELTSTLSPTEQAAIFSGTARRIYGLQ
jgi:L-fuconolactonase